MNDNMRRSAHNLNDNSLGGLLKQVDFSEALYSSITNRQVEGACINTSRMLELAHLNGVPEPFESKHLRECPSCAKWWAMHRIVAEKNLQPSLPQRLRDVVKVNGIGVAFPDGSIGVTTTQWGRLEDIQRRDSERFQDLVDEVAQALVTYLNREVTNDPDETVVLAAFGNIVHHCARRAANLLAMQGFRQVEVVGVHGFENPRFECSIEAFRGATVVCIGDVAHHGQLLERMAEVATSLSAGGWVHKLAFVKQISKDDGAHECNYDGLWFEETEDRFTPAEFEERLSDNVLQLFEPEICRSVPCSRLQFDAQYLNEDCHKCIELGAVKVGYDVGNIQYPFFVDTLKLLRLDGQGPRHGTLDFRTKRSRVHESQQVPSVLDRLPETLVRLATREVNRSGGRIALVYHVQRSERAGRIAEFIQTELNEQRLPVTCVPVGWQTGAVDDLTNKQAETTKEFDTILMIDSAMRTGEAMRSLYRMIREEVAADTRIVGLTVIGPRRCNSVLATEDTRISSNEMCEFKVWCAYAIPLLPPIESLGDRIREWKTETALWVEESEWLDCPESVSSILQQYCGTVEHSISRRQKTDQVLTRVMSKPWLKNAMEAVIESHCSNGKDHKAPAAFVLMALDEFEWISKKSWISSCSGWFTRATQSGSAYWPVFLLAFLWLAKRTLEPNCPSELKANGLSFLQRARSNLTDAVKRCRNKNRQVVLEHLLSGCVFSLSLLRSSEVCLQREATCTSD